MAEVPVASEIRAAMESIVQTLSHAGVQTERWLPKDFDLSKILNLYGRIFHVPYYLLSTAG